MNKLNKLQHDFRLLPKAVGSFCVMVFCPCGANALMMGQSLTTDSHCPNCSRPYDMEVIRRMRYAAEQNKGN